MQLAGVKGVIFDLDGTLLESRLDFYKMRQDVGCPQNEDILTFVAAIACSKTRSRAEQTIIEHELTDARTAGWLNVGLSMVKKVQQANLPMAIVTRNSREATGIKLKNNNVPISFVITREDAPPKPDPTALLLVAKKWDMAPADCLYVGDFMYDRLAAENAGMQWHLIK